jgi:uncharacterized protein
MAESGALSRRRALQFVSAVPMLPLAASMAGTAYVTDAAAARGLIYSFGGMAAPDLSNPAQMATTYVDSTVTVRRGRGRDITYRLGYETFFLTGQMVPATGGGQELTGDYVDIDNRPIVDTTDPGQRPFFSDCPDGMSLVALPGARSRRSDCHRIFAVVQFEYTRRNDQGDSMYGLLPSPIAVLTPDQDRRTGQLSLVSYHDVDPSGVHGCGSPAVPACRRGVRTCRARSTSRMQHWRTMRSCRASAATSTEIRPRRGPITTATCRR